jgi:hypothetical protein
MATKSSKKGMKATAKKGVKAISSASKGAAKTGTKKGEKATKAAKKGAGATKTKSTKARPTKTSGPTKSSKISVALGSTQISNIQLLPFDGPDAEDSVACRPKTTLPLMPDIISRVDNDIDPADGRIRLTLVLNSDHAILPVVPGCDPDGFFFLPERSSNVAAIGGPEYLGARGRKIRVKIFPANLQQPLPFTLAFRLRYNEFFGLVGTLRPRRKRGSVKVT